MAKTSVNISFGLVDVTAKEDSTAAVTDKQDFIDPQDLSLEGVYPLKAATLEDDYWKLDGTFLCFPDAPENYTWGLWSESMADENGNFENPVVLTLTFANLHSAKGLTFEFNPYDNSFCNSLNVKWYKNEALLFDLDFEPNNWRYFCEKTVENYNKIVITFESMNKAHRYLKVQNIMHGILKDFGSNEIKSANLMEETDLSALTAPASTLEFEVYSESDDFNIFNPQGIYNLLQQKQQMSVSGAKGGKMINFGTYYVEELESKSNKIISISATDGVGIMDGTTFKGGMYLNKPAAELIEEIMEDAGFGYTLESSLAEKTITGYIPICSHREALQYVVFAINAFVATARSGTINIKAMPDLSQTPTKILSMSRKFIGTTVTLRELVTGVSLTEHNYTLDSTSSQICEVDVKEGLNEITFSEPAANISADLGSISESGVNYCIVNAASAGKCTITGKKYTDNTKTVSVKMADLPAGSKENIVDVDCTLICSENSKDCAEHLFNYYQYRIEQEMQFVMDEETTGDLVDIETEYGIFRGSIVESMDTNLTGGFITKAVVIGE